jgi:ferritin-like metal-binding protein YciE
MAEKDLSGLFHHTLKDVYFAENAILKALPKMAQAAQSADLKEAFQTHLEQTREQVSRLEQVFELLGEKAEGEPCEAIQGIIREGEEVMEEFRGGPALDAGLIAAAQAVEHYEIARYGSLCTWAEQLDMDEAKELLGETLDEEETTDQLLSDMAESKVNAEAL